MICLASSGITVIFFVSLRWEMQVHMQSKLNLRWNIFSTFVIELWRLILGWKEY